MLWPGREVGSIGPSVSCADDRLCPGTTWYSRICTCKSQMIATGETAAVEAAVRLQVDLRWFSAIAAAI